MKAKSVGVTFSTKYIADILGVNEDDLFDYETSIDTILDREYRKVFPSHIFSLEHTEIGDDTSLVIYDMLDSPIELHEYAQLLRLNKEAFEKSIDQIKLIFG